MDTLAAFLARHQPQMEEVVTWGALRLHVTSYLSADLPPAALITSVRAVVRDEARVLVVRDPESVHIVPGGRREPSETLEQTLRREVLEETGWHIDQVALVGFRHFHHLTPKPPGYGYPYPDFIHLIHRARPLRYDADARHTDGYELDATFVPLQQRHTLPLSAGERMFLETILASDALGAG